MIERKTILSDDRVYRYTLWREWQCQPVWGSCQLPSGHIGSHSQESKGYAMFIGLNPSTADETLDDPTIRRCVGFAKRWGYSALCMTNLFAIRTKDPSMMKKHPFPAGQDNHSWILRCASEAGIVVAAWGKDGRHQNQDLNVREWVNSVNAVMFCLKLNRDGTPQHPLYVPADTVPKPYA